MADHDERRLSSPKETSTPPGKDGNNVPSGFVLKLYQMVNGAPDEVISWLPSGDAFKISDLHRLENETLPTFFRHKRFQSLVRQLNFYNFRKVNRERTFWVYRHPLFHRDRPSELHLLRRRTCPGVDGRKNRPELDISMLETSSTIPGQVERKNLLADEETLQDDSSAASDNTELKLQLKLRRKIDQGPRKKIRLTIATSDFSLQSSGTSGVSVERQDLPPQPHNQNMEPNMEVMQPKTILDLRIRHTLDQQSPNVCIDQVHQTLKEDGEDLSGTSEAAVELPLSSHENPSSSGGSENTGGGLQNREHPLLPCSLGSDNEDGEEVSRAEQAEQCALVSQVARELEAHIRRATEVTRKANRRSSLSTRNAGTVTPPRITDTMKYNALTYDDEVVGEEREDYAELEKASRDKSGAVIVKTALAGNVLVVTDGDESEDESHARSHPRVTCGSFPRVVSSCQMSSSTRDSQLKSKFLNLDTPPIENGALIAAVGRKLLDRLGREGFSSKENGHVAATVAGFCMSTAPMDPNLPTKILQLMSSCTPLANEFLRYRFALDPNSSPLDLLPTMSFHQQTVIMRRFLEGPSKKEETMRDFKVFMVNCLEDVVGDSKIGNFVGLRDAEVSALCLSGMCWSQSTAL